MTASVLAGKLGLALLQVRLHGFITKYMGETAPRLTQVFDSRNQTRAVYFFDQPDAIGSQRRLTNDVREIRTILNGFLQMVQQEHSFRLVVAATNHFGILDPALFRRFADVLHHALPDDTPIASALRTGLPRTPVQRVAWGRPASPAAHLSHTHISPATDEALTDALINSRSRRVGAETSTISRIPSDGSRLYRPLRHRTLWSYAERRTISIGRTTSSSS